MLIDHIGIAVTDIARSRAFYDAALKPLGIGVIADYEEAVGYAEVHEGGDIQAGRQSFWLGGGRGAARTHIAFAARSCGAVEAFYSAALEAGGRDNGGPGLRENYGPTYYAAFVLDPDGHNVEAVCNH